MGFNFIEYKHICDKMKNEFIKICSPWFKFGVKSRAQSVIKFPNHT